MGKSQSKTEKISGDPQVQIVNNQNLHTAYHEENNLLLWVICVMVALLLLLELHKRYKSSREKNAMRTARSIARLTDIITEK